MKKIDKLMKKYVCGKCKEVCSFNLGKSEKPCVMIEQFKTEILMRNK